MLKRRNPLMMVVICISMLTNTVYAHPRYSQLEINKARPPQIASHQVNGFTQFGLPLSPLSLTRVQKDIALSDLSSGSLVVTYTLLNTLPPINVPVLPPSSTTTDTLNAWAVFNSTDDPNIVRGIVFTNS
jgi:hypothetical protein